MDDAMRELELKTICPTSDNWPDNEKALLAARNEIRAFVANAFDYILSRWQAQIDDGLKPAKNSHEEAIHAQIRDRLYNMKAETRMSWLEKNCGEIARCGQHGGDHRIVAHACWSALGWATSPIRAPTIRGWKRNFLAATSK